MQKRHKKQKNFFRADCFVCFLGFANSLLKYKKFFRRFHFPKYKKNSWCPSLSIKFNQPIFQHLFFMKCCLVLLPSGQFFPTRNILNPNHGLKYFDNPHLFSNSSSFRVQGLGIGLYVIFMSCIAFKSESTLYSCLNVKNSRF